MKIDLHLHTTASDGTYTPKELVYYAKEKNLDLIAITDHDCLKALSEIHKYGEKLGIKIVDGIEFAGFYIDREIHILGLFVDIKDKKFVNIVNEIEQGRIERNQKMCHRFNDLGIPITIEDLSNGNPDKIITRSHFAEYLVNNGYTETKEDAFDKYLWDGCPTYLPREYYNTKEIIEIIHNAGGIAVLAHPTLYKLSNEGIETLVAQMCDDGLDAIEGYYSTYTKEEEDFVHFLAKKYDLTLSGGSDFHGDTKPGLDMKVGYGNLVIPDSLIDVILDKYNYTV